MKKRLAALIIFAASFALCISSEGGAKKVSQMIIDEANRKSQISTHYQMITEARGKAKKLSQKDMDLLMRVSQAEAGNQSVEGRVMVINTVLNRVESERFPNTVEGVLSQKGQFVTWPGAIKKAKPTSEDSIALELALSDYRDKTPYFFERTISKSTWHSRNLSFLFAIGDHSFYTFKE